MQALLTGEFPDPVEIDAAARAARRPSRWPPRRWATAPRRAGVVKDAGDDPDVTHGALILATVRRGARRERRQLSAPARASAR